MRLSLAFALLMAIELTGEGVPPGRDPVLKDNRPFSEAWALLEFMACWPLFVIFGGVIRVGLDAGLGSRIFWSARSSRFPVPEGFKFGKYVVFCARCICERSLVFPVLLIGTVLLAVSGCGDLKVMDTSPDFRNIFRPLGEDEVNSFLALVLVLVPAFDVDGI